MHAGADAHTDKIHALFADAGIKTHRVSHSTAALASSLCTSTSAAQVIKSQYPISASAIRTICSEMNLKKQKKDARKVDRLLV